jgi:hypothetical protein
MPTTVRDASLVTKKNRDVALYAYQQSFVAATMNTSNANAALTAPAATSAEVVKQVQLGCTACVAFNNFVAGNTTDNIQRYPFNPSAGGAGALTGTS